MIIDKKQMDDMHVIQYNIFKEFHNVCQKLGLQYYIVHGSLIGALRYNSFFPMDDDIDVAMPRHDYDILIEKGKDYFNERYFVQSSKTDSEYPLTFAKIRDSQTTFIQPIMAKCNINQGMYIDVFPIDYYPTNKLRRIILQIIKRILTLRVNTVLNDSQYTSTKHKVFQFFSKILLPSWKLSMKCLDGLYASNSESPLVFVNGGKVTEIGIDANLFGNPITIKFNDIQSYAPEKYKEYLKIIYGADYLNYSPVEKYLVDETHIEISANIIDVHKSYLKYKS